MPRGIYERKPRKHGPAIGTRQKVSASAWIENRPKYEMSMTPYAVTSESRRGARNSDESVDIMEG